MIIAGTALGQESLNPEFRYEKGKSYRYSLTNNSSFIQEMMGQENKGNTMLTQQGTLNINDVDEKGVMTGTFTWEDFSTRTKVMQTDTVLSFDSYKGKTCDISLTGKGKMRITRSDSTVIIQGAPVTPVNTMLQFMSLPEHPVAKGDTFLVKTIDTAYDANNNPTITEISRKYVYERRMMAPKDILCYVFGFEGTVASSGNIETMGVKMYQETEGTEKGELLLSENGILVAVHSSNEKEMTMAVSGQMGMTMSMTLHETADYRLE